MLGGAAPDWRCVSGKELGGFAVILAPGRPGSPEAARQGQWGPVCRDAGLREETFLTHLVHDRDTGSGEKVLVWPHSSRKGSFAMMERVVEPHASVMCVHPTERAVPRPALSSAQVGWNGLSVQAVQAPSARERWPVPSTSPLTLVVVTAGALHLEWRSGPGSWKGEDLHPGDVFLHGGGPASEVRWWSLSAVPLQLLELQVSRALVEAVAQEVVGVELADLQVVGPACGRDPLLTQLALGLQREQEQPTPAGELYAQTSARLIAVHLLRQYALGSPRRPALLLSTSGLTERQLKRVVEFIQTHLEEKLSVEQVARQVGFSPHHFALLFRKATGASPHQYMLQQRVERAAWLLQESELPLAQVASACGFAHQSHLTRVFQRHLGCTPRAYRQSDASAQDGVPTSFPR